MLLTRVNFYIKLLATDATYYCTLYTVDFSVITQHTWTQDDAYHRFIYNKLRHSLVTAWTLHAVTKLCLSLVTAWTLHATHTIQTLGQIRDLVSTLPPPCPI